MPDGIITNTIENERAIGMKDINIANVLSNNTTAYTTSNTVQLARAISGKLTEKITTTTLYSDDSVESTRTSVSDVTLEIEVNALSPFMQSLIFGRTLEKGILSVNQADTANPVAISFRAKNNNNKYEFYQFYNIVFEPEARSFQTLADKEKTQTIKIKGTCTPMIDTGDYYITVDEQYLAEDETEAANAIKTWFSKVQIKKDILVPVASATAAVS